MAGVGWWRLRPYDAGDAAAVDGLLDEHTDALWIAQGHALHGAAREGERWRRTLVAEVEGRVVGAATVARNRVHPGRYSGSVEVSSRFRGKGLGGVLLDAIRRERPQLLPVAGKVRPWDGAAIALVTTRGGGIYQRCPGLTPDPGSIEVQDWCRRQAPPPGVRVVPLASLPMTQRADLWQQQYLWVHQDWSPASADALREVSSDLVAEADPDLSVVTTWADRVVSVAWAFPETTESFTIVCETVKRHTPQGHGTVAAALARCLTHLADTHASRVNIDGHDTDPHLAPVLRTLPAVPSEPLLLIDV